jgi:hypothetical protein
MLASAKYYPVHRVLVYVQKPRCRTNANSFSSMMNYLPNLFVRQMKSKKGRGPRWSKTFPARSTIQKLSGFVLAIFTAKSYVTGVSQPVILTAFVGTKSILDISHRSPPTC